MTKCSPDLSLQLFKKKKLFRSELDHKFGFTPFYGTVPFTYGTVHNRYGTLPFRKDGKRAGGGNRVNHA